MFASGTPAERPGTGERLLTVSQAADLFGVSTHTLRFYESAGLIAPSRTSGRHRRYCAEDLETLRELLELRDAGMPLAQLRAYVRLRSGVSSYEQQLELLLAHEAQLRAHSATLRRHLRATEKQIECHHHLLKTMMS